jgi:hypothetical protein
MVVDTTMRDSIIEVNFRNCQGGKCLRRAYTSAYYGGVHYGSAGW